MTQHDTPQARRSADHVWRGLLRVTALAAAVGVTVLALVGGTVTVRADVPPPAAAAKSAPGAPGAPAQP